MSHKHKKNLYDYFSKKVPIDDTSEQNLGETHQTSEFQYKNKNDTEPSASSTSSSAMLGSGGSEQNEISMTNIFDICFRVCFFFKSICIFDMLAKHSQMKKGAM